MHKLSDISKKFSFEEVQVLRRKRHTSSKKTTRKEVSNIKENLKDLSKEELKRLKDLL